jgi:hypothetical protein
MNIYDFIENCYVDRHLLDESIRVQIPGAYEDQQWIRVSQVFVRGLDRTHQIPGKVIYSILDICEQFRQTETLSPKQQHFLAQNLIDYWDQMSCEARSKLYIG